MVQWQKKKLITKSHNLTDCRIPVSWLLIPSVMYFPGSITVVIHSFLWNTGMQKDFFHVCHICVTEIRWNHWCSYVYFHCVHYTKIWFTERRSCSKTAKISSCPKLFVDYIAVPLLIYWVHQYFNLQVGKWLFEAVLLSTMCIVCIMLNRWCCTYSILCCRWSLMTDVTCQKWR